MHCILLFMLIIHTNIYTQPTPAPTHPPIHVLKKLQSNFNVQVLYLIGLWKYFLQAKKNFFQHLAVFVSGTRIWWTLPFCCQLGIWMYTVSLEIYYPGLFIYFSIGMFNYILPHPPPPPPTKKKKKIHLPPVWGLVM